MARVRTTTRGARPPRRGVAATELAVCLPLLAFLAAVAVDFARVFYYSTTLANCARNGAVYQSDPYARAESPYQSLTDAALADAPSISGDPTNLPTVTAGGGTDATGAEYVEVTVSYNFRTVSAIPGVPSQMPIARIVRMAKAPLNPTR